MFRKIGFATLAVAAGAIVFMAGAPARAQETNAAPQNASQTGAETVVVTARRRPEDVEKIPVSVTPISGDALREHGVTSLAAQGIVASPAEVDVALKRAFADVFGEEPVAA